MNDNQKQLAILAGIVGAFTGSIAGLIGDSLLNGLLAGGLTSAVVSLLYPNGRYEYNAPRINIVALSPSGLCAGIVSSLVTEAGWIGTFISSGVGWVIGLILPAVLIAIFKGNQDD